MAHLTRLCSYTQRRIAVFIASLVILLYEAISKQFPHYDCVIQGVYEVKAGRMVQRPHRRAIGKRIIIDKRSGEVKGYFGTDGYEIVPVKRPPDDGILNLELAEGVLGNSANILRVKPRKPADCRYNFFYRKSWLYITGVCR